MEEEGLLSMSLGPRREQLWLTVAVTVAEMRHCPPMASWQGTPTRSCKSPREQWEGAQQRYHVPPRNTGGDLEGGVSTPQAGGGTANAMRVITTKIIIITSSADA